MSKYDYMWQFHEGRVYDFEDLKLPYVVPVIESLPYETNQPVAVDVGGGSFSIIHSARLPRPRYFRTATVDIAAKAHGLEPINPTVRADVEEITTGQNRWAGTELETFLADGADLILFSEILNYVDLRSVMFGFDQGLKPGGYMVIANLPTRGWPGLFSDMGCKTHDELIGFVKSTLGHDVVVQNYPWGPTDDYEGFMVLASQKPKSTTQLASSLE